MPSIGLINEKGQKVLYQDILKGYDRKDWYNLPPTVTLSLTRQKRVYHQFLKNYKGDHLNLSPSTTELIKPTKAYAFGKCLYWYEDLGSIIKREIGSMRHEVAERQGEQLSEFGYIGMQTEGSYIFPVEVDGQTWYVPMTVDIENYNERCIDDWKFSSGYKMKLCLDPANWEIGGKVEDFTLQGNIYRYGRQTEGCLEILKDKNGIPTGELLESTFDFEKIFFNVIQSEDKSIDQMRGFEVPLMKTEDVRGYLQDRVRLAVEARALADQVLTEGRPIDEIEGALPDCLPKEQWQSSPYFQVIRPGNTRATANFSKDKHGSIEAARIAAMSDCKRRNEKKKSGPDYYVEQVQPTRKRCIGYCPAAGICRQAKEESTKEELKLIQERWERERGELEVTPCLD